MFCTTASDRRLDHLRGPGPGSFAHTLLEHTAHACFVTSACRAHTMLLWHLSSLARGCSAGLHCTFGRRALLAEPSLPFLSLPPLPSPPISSLSLLVLMMRLILSFMRVR